MCVRVVHARRTRDKIGNGIFQQGDVKRGLRRRPQMSVLSVEGGLRDDRAGLLWKGLLLLSFLVLEYWLPEESLDGSWEGRIAACLPVGLRDGSTGGSLIAFLDLRLKPGDILIQARFQRCDGCSRCVLPSWFGFGRSQHLSPIFLGLTQCIAPLGCGTCYRLFCGIVDPHP